MSDVRSINIKTNKDINFNNFVPNYHGGNIEQIRNVNTNVESVQLSNVQIEEMDLNVDNIKSDENVLNKNKEGLNTLKSYLNKSVNDINDEIKSLDEQRPKTFNFSILPESAEEKAERLKKVVEIDDKIKELKSQIRELKQYIKQIDDELKQIPYLEKIETEEYKKFVENYSSEYQGLDYEKLKECSYDLGVYSLTDSTPIDDIAIIEYILNNETEIDLQKLGVGYPSLVNAVNNYKYMSEDQRNMYHYLFKNEGYEKADEYLNVIENSMNQARGAEMAAEFINKLDTNDSDKLKTNIANLFNVNTKGLQDGVNTFCDGLQNVFENNENITATDYEKMIVLQYLQENSLLYDELYEFNSSLGNMIPSMMVGALSSFFLTPAGGSKVASGLMGLSAGGNAKHQALTNGSSILSATIYGILNGTSEATLQYFLGNIPGLSEEAGFTLKGLLQEGIEEYSQEWIDAGLQATVLGEDINWDEIPENANKSFLMGVLMSGFLNGEKQVVNLSINENQTEINVEEVLDYIEKNPECDLTEAVEFQAGVKLFSKDNSYYEKLYEKNPNKLVKILQKRDFSDEIIEHLFNNLSKNEIVNIVSSGISYTDYYNVINEYNSKVANYNDNFFTNIDLYSSGYNYGADQGFINEQYYFEVSGMNGKYSEYEIQKMKENGKLVGRNVTKIASDEYFRLKNKLINQGFNGNTSSVVLSGLDSKGACSYASIINGIFSKFSNDPKGFYEHFGFDMYTRDKKGAYILNTGELLIDMYVTLNSKENGGHLFGKNDDGSYYIDYSAINQHKDVFGRILLDAKNQQYMSTIYNINDSLINQYLNAKGISLNSEVISPFFRYNTKYEYIENCASNVASCLLNGKSVQLVLASNKNHNINMYRVQSDGSSFLETSTNSWNEGGAHAVYVTAVTNNGFIVSSWGKKYFISFADLQGGDFQLSSFDIKKEW